MDSKQAIADKQFIAKVLYTREHLDQKTIAQRVKVSEKTISKWKEKFKWDELRKKLILTKETELMNLYDQLEKMNKAIKDSPKGFPDYKLSHSQKMLTASIRDLETNLGIAEIVESGIRFIKHIQQVGTGQQVIEFSDLWNSFLQSQLKR